MTEVTLLMGEPTIEVIAEMALNTSGLQGLERWLKEHRPACDVEESADGRSLFPHTMDDAPISSDEPQLLTGRILSDNEELAELAGRKCYDSFGSNAGRKTNRDYFEHIFGMDPIHASIGYHCKMTFFFAGVSRKFSHQFIRNYVGSDRSEEGCPSQESTRYTRHYGYYVAPPYVAAGLPMVNFRLDCQENYAAYCKFLDREITVHTTRFGGPPKGQDKKDIFEAAAGLLNMSAETSFVWTTNPMAIRKFLKERCHEAADAEIDRFARNLARICFGRWPNLFLGSDLDNVRERCVVPK